MISRTQHSVQERDTRSRAAQLLANRPFLRGFGTAVPLLRQVLLPLPTRATASGSLSLHPFGQEAGLHLHSKALHETVRQWVENGRRVKRLVDQVSQQHLQTLLERKQPLVRGKGGAAPHRRTIRRDGTVLCLCR